MKNTLYILVCAALCWLVVPSLYAQTTARVAFDDVQTLAVQQGTQADLLAVTAADLAPDGTATAWLYLYATDQGPLAVLRDGANLSVDAFDPTGFDAILADAIPLQRLPDDWLDSEAAFAAAEAHAGMYFRATHADAQVTALLTTVPDHPQLQDNLPDPVRWTITYTSPSAQVFETLHIDAVTGTVRVDQPMQPREAVALTTTTADVTWSEEPALFDVRTFVPDLSTTGTSTAWIYTFFSAAHNSVRSFFVRKNADGELDVFASVEQSVASYPTVESLGDWIEASEALAQARVAYTQRIGSDADAHTLVEARLARGLRTDQPNRAVWEFRFVSFAAGALVTVHVDAETGEAIGVDTDTPSVVPEAFALAQNYPNPFNPSTQIAYTLPQAADVHLAVYDLLGREVAVLANDFQAAGAHAVTFDGANLPSGLYVYQLATPQQTRTRTMTLLK